jgi:hypothetical protein
MKMATILESKRKEILAVLPLLEKNAVWVAQHLGDLRKTYPDQFVAVQDQKVIDTATSRKELLKKLEKRDDVKDSVAIEFIGTKPFKFLV